MTAWDDASAAIRPYLLSRERVVWTGRPDPNRIFARGDLYMVPFSLMWGGFAIFWEAGVLGSGAPGFFALWGVPFVLIGQYVIWGRFIYKRWDRRRTVYAVTDQRVLSVAGKSLRTVLLRQLSVINVSRRADGSGTIQFGDAHQTFGSWADSGMDWFGRGRAGPLALRDIPDVDGVYRLIARPVDQGTP